MKKLFTLALALSVAFCGYSQVKSMSHKDKQTVSTMKKVERSEGSTLANVQSQPNMTRTGGELDYTTYDWQSNDGARTWTIVWPDGKINFGFTCASDGSYSDRGTAIGTYDAVNDEWIASGGRVEQEKTGFGSIARFGQNGIIVAAHTASECGLYLIEDKDNISNGCAITLPKLDNTNDPTWPNVMTSGPNRDIIHIIVTAYTNNVPGMEEVTDPMIYFRSMDGGQTWDKQNEVLPYMGPEDAIDWTANSCYWMETTEDNCLALVVNNAWSDGMVLYSYDDGETWNKKTFYHHPGPKTDLTDHMVAYPRWTSAQWGMGGELCLAYEFNGTTGVPGSGSYYPSLGGVAFWSENMPYRSSEYAQFGYDPTNPMPPVEGQAFIMDSAYVYQDIYASWPLFSDGTHVADGMLPEYMGYLTPLTDDGEPEDPYNPTGWNIEDRGLHGAYNSGCVAMPVLAVVPGSNGSDMVAVWSAMDENNMDGTNYFYKLFASYSPDGGRTWADMRHLTNDFTHIYSECVYSQAAVYGTTLVIAAQVDGTTGTYVQSDDPDETDNLYEGFTFELEDLWPGIGVGTTESKTTSMNVYPNPAVDQLNVVLNQNSEVVIINMMGQVVRTVEGHVGANTIDLSGLTSGVYFISAGSTTQKFVVK